MALRRQRRARIVQEEDESSWLFGNEQIIKLLHFLSYLKWANNFTLPKNIITDFRLARVLCDLHCMMNKSLTPYLHCTRLRCITAPQPPELICHAVGSFWSVSLRCITKDRHLVYFWQIIIIIVSLSSKNISNRHYIWLSSLYYTIVNQHPKSSCEDASFPCHNVFSWKWFIVKCVLNVNSY